MAELPDWAVGEIEGLERENNRIHERLNNLRLLLAPEGKWNTNGTVHADIICTYLDDEVDTALKGAADE